MQRSFECRRTGLNHRHSAAKQHSLTSPSAGYYRAEVLAQHPRYTAVGKTSGTDNTAPQRAALGDPGPINVVSLG